MNDEDDFEDKEGEPRYCSFQFTAEEWLELKDYLEEVDRYGIILDLSFMQEKEVPLTKH